MELMIHNLHMECKAVHTDTVSELSTLRCQACLAAELRGLLLLISLSPRILSFSGKDRKKRYLGEVSPDEAVVTA